MIFNTTTLPGAMLIEPQLFKDERGLFCRTMCRKEFSENGLEADFVQQNSSRTERSGSIRGMHFQLAPHAEDKLVRCIAGAIYDVIVDLRMDSKTFLKHEGFTLSAENRAMLYVPKGFAHGFQTLNDQAEVSYLVTSYYAPQFERGLRFDDAILGIEWPMPVADLSEKDAAWPLLPSSEPQFFAAE